MTNAPVPSTNIRIKGLYYGAACLPTVRGVLWECPSRDAYIDMRSAYEACERNCNTCRHLTRIPHDKCQHGFLQGTCNKHSKPLRFHPEQPDQMSCWESRREDTK
jgi:hypothetical protein